MSTVEITEQSFEKTIAKEIVVLDWWASWCGPCRTFAPVFERASAEHPDIVFGKIDIDAQQSLAAEFEVRSIPTLMVFRDGILIFAQPGALAAPQLAELLDKVRRLDMDEVRRAVDDLEREEPARDPKAEK